MSRAVARLHRGIAAVSRQQWNCTTKRTFTSSSRKSHYSLWSGRNAVVGTSTIVGIFLYVHQNKVLADAPVDASITTPIRKTKQDPDTKVQLPVLLDKEGHANQRLVGEFSSSSRNK